MLPKLHRVRLAKSFAAVRQKGQSLPAPLFILSFLSSPLPISRFGFIASKKVGNAVQRNRATRLLRQAAKENLPNISGSYDIILIARAALGDKKAPEVSQQLTNMLKKAKLLKND